MPWLDWLRRPDAAESEPGDAVARDDGDSIRRTIEVRPDGESLVHSVADIVSDDARFAIDVPAEALPGSA